MYVRLSYRGRLSGPCCTPVSRQRKDVEMRQGFADRLMDAVERKRSHVIVGFDPSYDLLPPELREEYDGREYHTLEERKAASFEDFLGRMLEALADTVVGVKLQLAYFEALGAVGYQVYEGLVRRAREAGLLVIADAKRGDIGSTAQAYADAHLGLVGADAMTVNPWFGSDGVEPFLVYAREEGKGLFVLVKTSNPSSAELQDVVTLDGSHMYERVAELVQRWGADTHGERGYSAVGAVVGGTHPQQAKRLREMLPDVPFLVPGYGAQGAAPEELKSVFDAQGTGAVVNSARAILYAYRTRSSSWLDAAREEAEAMRAALWEASGRA
jgi:orotidine-5'-phosphate decarboxylase